MLDSLKYITSVTVIDAYTDMGVYIFKQLNVKLYNTSFGGYKLNIH